MRSDIETEASPRDDISTWAPAIEDMIARGRLRHTNRVVVLAETDSTQDAARRLCGDKPGLLVLAGRQTAGRGRLGRAWADTSHLGVAATFVLPGAMFDDGYVSLLGGWVALCACGRNEFGLRWPNDVVEWNAPHRKVAGILIERSEGLIYLGIGINVLQRDSDWPEELRDRAVSLRRAGIRTTRLATIEFMVHLLDAYASWSRDLLVSEWQARNLLLGQRLAFQHNNQRYFGEVIDIDPTSAIRLRTREHGEISLPALTTSLVHD